MSPLCEERYVPLERAGGRYSSSLTEYAYFSSYSDSWVAHARDYVTSVVERFGLGGTARWSSWPATTATCSNTSSSAAYPRWSRARCQRRGGSPGTGDRDRRRVLRQGVASRLVAEGREADLLIANNVFAHVPDLNDFAAGMRRLLPQGVITIEFPHLARLIDENQFDTIYHEHFSYFSFLTARTVLAAHGLEVFDVEELARWPLRVRQRAGAGRPACAVSELAEREGGSSWTDTPHSRSAWRRPGGGCSSS